LGDISEAQTNFERALEIQKEIGEKGQAAQTRVDLALVLLEQGHSAQAEAAVQESANEFQAEKASRSEAIARRVLAESELRLGKLDLAREAIDKATKLLATSDDRELQEADFITAARIDAASGDLVTAAKSLASVIESAAKFGLHQNEFE